MTWNTWPTVNSAEPSASCSTPAKYANPVATITGPSLGADPARQDASPLPMNDQPTSSSIGSPGSSNCRIGP